MDDVETFEFKLNTHEETDELIENAYPARRMFLSRPVTGENNPEQGTDMRMVKKLAEYLEQGILLEPKKKS